MFKPLIQYPNGPSLLEYLRRELAETNWTDFRAAVAFAKLSGVSLIYDQLAAFAKRGGLARLSVGIDLFGTSREALQALLQAVGENGEVWVCHNEAASTYHPKIYLFHNDRLGRAYVGSGNLTAGGLYANYEAGLVCTLGKGERQYSSAAGILEALDQWSNSESGTAKRLTPDLLDQLVSYGYIRDEASSSSPDGDGSEQMMVVREPQQALFKQVVPQRPGRQVRQGEDRQRLQHTSTIAARDQDRRGYVMTLQRTDVGTGQTSVGTARRSPEVFIPLAARDENPDFWGFPGYFTEDGAKPGKWDRRNVQIRLGGRRTLVNMMTWPDKHDFRLRSEDLRSSGNVGDILRIEEAPEGANYQYDVEIIPQGSRDFDHYERLCRQRVRNSAKRYGYY